MGEGLDSGEAVPGVNIHTGPSRVSLSSEEREASLTAVSSAGPASSPHHSPLPGPCGAWCSGEVWHLVLRFCPRTKAQLVEKIAGLSFLCGQHTMGAVIPSAERKPSDQKEGASPEVPVSRGRRSGKQGQCPPTPSTEEQPAALCELGLGWGGGKGGGRIEGGSWASEDCLLIFPS